MKRAGIIALLLIISTPVLTSAKSPQMKGFDRIKGARVVSSAPLGWPLALEATSGVVGTVQSLPGMSVVRLSGYKPWWKFWRDVPATTSVTISGLPSQKSLHIYTRGYREHNELKTTKEGKLTLQFASKPGAQFIIKSTPSTKHIAIDPIFGPPGGDCNTIGSWDAAAKKCTLNTDVRETIAIEDAGITLDGNNKSVIGMGAGDGIFTDESNVRVTNIEVHHFDRGIAFADSLFTLARGGQIDGTTLADNVLNIMDEGISDLIITDNDIVAAGSGISILDQFDGFATDGIEITRNNFKLITNNDVFNSAASIALNTMANRGNWWQKNTNCVQNATEPDHCDNSYSTGFGVDNAPWACENAWRTGVVCPTNPEPPPTGGETWAEITSSSGVAKIYMDAIPDESRVHKILPNNWILKVQDSSGVNWMVNDVTDGTTGWVKSDNLRVDPLKQSEWEQKAVVSQDTVQKRKQTLQGAVNHYYDNTSPINSLYSSNDKSKSGTNNLSFLKSFGFPLPIILAKVAWEADSSFNNEFVSFDYGHGLGQITFDAWSKESSGLFLKNSWDNRGYANRIEIPKCKSIASETYKTCYTNTSTQNTQPKQYVSYKYYTNSHQSIFSNIKDGMGLLSNYVKLADSRIGTTGKNWAEPFNLPIQISDFDLKILSGLKNYNAGPGSYCSPISNPYNPNYLKSIGQELASINSTFPGINYVDTQQFVEKLKFGSNYHDRVEICSPAYLQVLDQTNNISGFNGTDYLNEIGNVVYDEGSNKVATLLFPNGAYRYRVIGADNGSYSLFSTSYANGGISLSATSIPISLRETHEYSPSWLDENMTVKVDKDGDGKFESEFSSDLNLTGAEFESLTTKFTICHIPPGNPSNKHAISINSTAWKAHEKHGDYKGECTETIQSNRRKKK